MVKKEKTYVLVDIAVPDDSNFNAKGSEKLSEVQRPGDQGQQDVESEDKICANYNCSIRNS
jgi:hypothetical protein